MKLVTDTAIRTVNTVIKCNREILQCKLTVIPNECILMFIPSDKIIALTFERVLQPPRNLITDASDAVKILIDTLSGCLYHNNMIRKIND